MRTIESWVSNFSDEKRIEAYYKQACNMHNYNPTEENYFSIWPKNHGKPLIYPDSIRKECSPFYQIEEVENFIKKSNHFLSKRYNQDEGAIYCEEIITLQEVYFNENEVFWIAEKPKPNNDEDKHGHLILIENYTKKDDEVKDYGNCLTSEMLQSCGINSFFNNRNNLEEFNKQPIEFLRKSRCSFPNSGEFKVLYRVIATCKDELNGSLTSTLGYPITIRSKFYKNPSGYPRNFNQNDKIDIESFINYGKKRE